MADEARDTIRVNRLLFSIDWTSTMWTLTQDGCAQKKRFGLALTPFFADHPDKASLRRQVFSNPTVSHVEFEVPGQEKTDLLVKPEGVSVAHILEWMEKEDVRDMEKVRVIVSVPTGVKVVALETE